MNGVQPVLIRPISILRLWISEGLTLKQNFNIKGWNSHVHRNFPDVSSQAILAGIILVGRLGVQPAVEQKTARRQKREAGKRDQGGRSLQNAPQYHMGMR